MEMINNDGGRAKAGLNLSQTDCAVRAIAIATGSWYASIHQEMIDRGLYMPKSGTLIHTNEMRRYLQAFGFYFVPITGRTVRLHELPHGRIIAWVRNYAESVNFSHLTAIIDGVVQDVYDPRPLCVSGYWVYNPAKQFNVLRADMSKANRFPLNYEQALSMRNMLEARGGAAAWVI